MDAQARVRLGRPRQQLQGQAKVQLGWPPLHGGGQMGKFMALNGFV